MRLPVQLAVPCAFLLYFEWWLGVGEYVGFEVLGSAEGSDQAVWWSCCLTLVWHVGVCPCSAVILSGVHGWASQPEHSCVEAAWLMQWL